MPQMQRPSSTTNHRLSAVAEEDRLLAALAVTARSDSVLAQRMLRRLDRLRRTLDRTRLELDACRVALASGRAAATCEALNSELIAVEDDTTVGLAMPLARTVGRRGPTGPANSEVPGPEPSHCVGDAACRAAHLAEHETRESCPRAVAANPPRA